MDIADIPHLEKLASIVALLGFPFVIGQLLVAHWQRVGWAKARGTA